jgi:hypothetical protein
MPPEGNDDASREIPGSLGKQTLCTRYAAHLRKGPIRHAYVSLIVAMLASALGWRTLIELRSAVQRIMYLACLAAFLCVTYRHYLSKHA